MPSTYWNVLSSYIRLLINVDFAWLNALSAPIHCCCYTNIIATYGMRANMAVALMVNCDQSARLI